MSGLTYREAGVDIDAGDRAAAEMKRDATRTFIPGVITGLSDFGGLFAVNELGLRDPVLVMGTDSVGTKLKIAFALDRHDTVGHDVVAMCADDIVVHGARPVCFLDYLGIGHLREGVAEAIVRGVADACVLAGCALIGGETAELPGMYAPGEYDLAGFAVGVVERDSIIDGSQVQEGDVLLGLASSGLHSNGFSLARRALLEHAELALDSAVPWGGCTLGEELLRPTRIYAKHVSVTVNSGTPVHGMAHITGGGLPGNVCRIIPAGLTAHIEKGSFPHPPIFDLIREAGGVAEAEMYRTFNMGVGMVLAVPPDEVEAAKALLTFQGETVYTIGQVERGDERVRLS